MRKESFGCCGGTLGRSVKRCDSVDPKGHAWEAAEKLALSTVAAVYDRRKSRDFNVCSAVIDRRYSSIRRAKEPSHQAKLISSKFLRRPKHPSQIRKRIKWSEPSVLTIGPFTDIDISSPKTTTGRTLFAAQRIGSKRQRQQDPLLLL